MSIEILKMLIQNACSDGTISENDRKLLEKKAPEAGVSLEELNSMIENEINKHNQSSGFVTAEIPQEDSSSSGFVTAEENDTSSSSGFVTAEDSNNTSSTSSGFVTAEEPAEKEPKVQPQPVRTPTFDDKLTDVQELSSQGAMSKVYKGKLYGKWIIVKRIKPEFKDNAQYRNLFMKEFDNCYGLDHENIVKILDKGEDSEGLYYTMEYVDGRSLSDCIKKGELKNERLIKSVIKQLCSALSYVHKKQIVHRDLKPDNIMITYRGDNVKILDFGIAYTDSYDDNLVKVGTPKYAAPEQMGKGNLVDQRADIYAVGLILLEMATGSLEDRHAETVKNPNFKLVINKATETAPENRYHDCEELLEDLNKTIVIPVTPNEKPETTPETPEKKKVPVPPVIKPAEKEKTTPVEEEKKKKSILPIIIAAVVLLGLGLGVWFFLNKNKAPRQEQTEQTKETPQPVTDNQNQDNTQQGGGSHVQKPDNGDNNIPSKEEIKQNEEDSELKELLAEAERIMKEEKNIVKAKEKYEEILKKKKNNEAESGLKECEKIINDSQLGDLTQTEKDGKIGFKDQNGNVVIDYLYDNGSYQKAAQGHLQNNLYALKKDGKWGVIDNKTKLPVTEFKYESAAAVKDGFNLKISKGNSDQLRYSDGKITIKNVRF